MSREKDFENIPTTYKDDVNKAITILTGKGCKEIYLFGSLVHGDYNDNSDIDIAVTGIPKGDFFEIYGELVMSLDHPVDLINLEKRTRFVDLLKGKGELFRVA
jgi:predicted nucleotidyltransferase